MEFTLAVKNLKKKIATSLSSTVAVLCCLLNSNTAMAQEPPSGIEALKGNVESVQGGVDTATSTANTTKEASKSVNEFFSSEDDPKGKEIAPKQSQVIAQPVEKPGSLLDRLFGRVTGVQIYTQKEANNNSSILTEIVVVYKAELFQQVANIRVKDWFTMTPANKLMRSSNDIQVHRFETTPDLPYSEYLLDIDSGAMGAFLFSRTQNSLNNLPVRLNPYKNTKIKYFTFGFNFSQYPE